MKQTLEVYSDGGARGNPGKAACAFVVKKNQQVVKSQSFGLGIKTNNQAEYMGIVFALHWLKENKDTFDEVNYYLDSLLAVNQLNGSYKIKSDLIKPLAIKVKKLESQIGKKINFIHIKRESNKLADKLLNEKLDEN